MVNVLKFQSPYFILFPPLNIAFYAVVIEVLSDTANIVDPDQTAPYPDQTALEGAVWSGSALFAHAILSETLVYEILGLLPY